MGNKKRLPTLDKIRNGLPIISPGDKIYRSVEYSPDYFKMEGLVVGSTNKLNNAKSTAKKGDNFFDTINMKISTLDQDKLWKNRCVRESFEYDDNYVKNLNTWEDNYLEEIKQPIDDKKNIPINKNTNANIKKK
jgi:hypothetical protein